MPRLRNQLGFREVKTSSGRPNTNKYDSRSEAEIQIGFIAVAREETYPNEVYGWDARGIEWLVGDLYSHLLFA